MRFWHKPFAVQAMQYKSELGNDRIMNWLATLSANVSGWFFGPDRVVVPTTLGSKTVSNGDWIVSMPDGSFMVYAPDGFERVFEEDR